jgi:tRNA (guanine-N7-)-methyltransferase
MNDIRTFHARKGRVSAAEQDGIDRLLPVFGAPMGQLDLSDLFSGRPVVFEIGFGLGDATIAMAKDQPDLGIIAADVHTPGVGRLLNRIESEGLTNIRVLHGDAVEYLRASVPDDSLHGFRVFFPDPWPKARHHKRRLFRPDLVQLMVAKLRWGGRIHAATDWEPYAEVIRMVCQENPELAQIEDSPVALDGRPLTKFEAAGLRKGHAVTDLIYERRTPDSGAVTAVGAVPA